MGERRAYLRYKCSLPLFILDEAGQEYVLQTVDISMGGTRIECDTLVMRALLPDGLRTTPAHRVIYRARLFLSQEQKPESLLQVKLQAVAATRLAENSFAVHFSFVDTTPEQLDQLERFTERLEA
jgi:hypothetical protein